jgi:hypothetical protein
MAAALPASILDLVLGLALASTDQDTSNRVSLDGLTVGPRSDGALDMAIRNLQAASLRLASGPLVLDLGELALRGIQAQVRIGPGRPRLASFEAANAELSGVKVQGPLTLPPRLQGGAPAPAASPAGQASGSGWRLDPLAAADGSVRAQIVDAHLLFDADVTVPIRQGQIDFNEATVEHVGPDSSMGVSRMGIYVDAPNGRSYLYQFPSAPLCGVEYEQRGALLGAWVTKRGKLRLQEFGESLLRQALGRKALAGLTEQARQLFERTAVSGEIRLGDGTIAAPGLQADLQGRAAGRNGVRLHAEAVGRGLTAELASLSIRNALLGSTATSLRCAEIAGSLTLRLVREGAEARFELQLGATTIRGLRFGPERP